MKLICLKSALKCDSFVVTIGIKIPFFRVSVTIEPGRSLPFVTTNCLKGHLTHTLKDSQTNLVKEHGFEQKKLILHSK